MRSWNVVWRTGKVQGVQAFPSIVGQDLEYFWLRWSSWSPCPYNKQLTDIEGTLWKKQLLSNPRFTSWSLWSWQLPSLGFLLQHIRKVDKKTIYLKCTLVLFETQMIRENNLYLWNMWNPQIINRYNAFTTQIWKMWTICWNWHKSHFVLKHKTLQI